MLGDDVPLNSWIVHAHRARKDSTTFLCCFAITVIFAIADKHPFFRLTKSPDVFAISPKMNTTFLGYTQRRFGTCSPFLHLLEDNRAMAFILRIGTRIRQFQLTIRKSLLSWLEFKIDTSSLQVML